MPSICARAMFTSLAFPLMHFGLKFDSYRYKTTKQVDTSSVQCVCVCVCLYKYIFKGLPSPAAGPFAWLVVTGWKLLVVGWLLLAASEDPKFLILLSVPTKDNPTLGGVRMASAFNSQKLISRPKYL